MKYTVKYTCQFKKDIKLAQRQQKNTDKLFEVVSVLAEGRKPDRKYRDHALSGIYKGTR